MTSVATSMEPSVAEAMSAEHEACRPLLLSMFSTLKQLFLHCEQHGRADLASEVVDALLMCKEDFSALAEQLRSGEPTSSATSPKPLADADRSARTRAAPCSLMGRSAGTSAPTTMRSGGGRAGGGARDAGLGPDSLCLASPSTSLDSLDYAAGGGGACGDAVSLSVSVATAISSPEASWDVSPAPSGLDSPNANAQMLAQLETLDIELLHEAAAYFDTPQVGANGEPELLPREEHERLYLRRAAADGRERQAKAFLASLQQIMRGVAKPRPAAFAPGPAGSAAPAAGAPMRLPASCASASGAQPAEEAAGAPGAADWEDPREKRRSRRRRLWGEAGDERAGERSPRSASPVPPAEEWLVPAVVPASSLPSTAHLEATEAETPAATKPPAAPSVQRGPSLLVEVAGAATEHSAAAELERQAKTPGAPGAGAGSAPCASLARLSAEALDSMAGDSLLGAPLSGTSASSRERIIPAWRAWRDEETPLALEDAGDAGLGSSAEEGVHLADNESLTASSLSAASGPPRRKRRPPSALLPATPTRDGEAGGSQAASPGAGSPGNKARREKLLSGESPERSADSVREAAERRHARAEAQRERLAAEEAGRLRAVREREEAVRGRKEAAAAERRRALEEKLARAEAARGESLGGIVSRARTENQKVEEVAFINKVNHGVDDKDAQNARTRAAEAAYARWTASIEQRAHRAAEAARRRELVRDRGRGAVATEQAALRLKAHQRSVDANQRRLALVQALLHQRRERAERRDSQLHGLLRERRGASDGEAAIDEAAVAGQAADGGGGRSSHRKPASGGRRRNARGLASVSEVRGGSAARGSQERSVSLLSDVSPGGGQLGAELAAAAACPVGSFEHRGAYGELYASETDLTEGEAPAEGSAGGGTAAATATAGVAAPAQAPPQPGGGAVSPPPRRQREAPPPSEEELEKRRKARARTKRVRSRMASAAASVRLDQLDWLWSAGAASGVHASKRLVKLAHSLAEVSRQPSSDGAEALAWEACKLLEGGRERELHAARQQGLLDSLVGLAAGPNDASGWPLPPRTSTQVAATRALLAACALPCNRSYLLLRNHAAGLATYTLACAVEAAAHDAKSYGMGFDADAYTPGLNHASAAAGGAAADGAGGAQTRNLLLPLLQLLRLLIATPPPVEAARRLCSDLVTLLIASGGIHSLQEHCAARAATLAQATAHGALLRHYIGLLHALLLPLRDDPAGASCATALRELLRETRLCGVPGLACAMLVEASHPDGGLTPRANADRPSDRPWADSGSSAYSLSLPGARVLSVCRLAVQLLAHVGAIDAPLLRRTLGATEPKAQLLHLVHLALDLCNDAGDATGADDRARAEEVRSLLHELLLLLGIFTHTSRANAELLRWRKGEHPTMLHRLVSLPFGYFCVPRLRAVLLPTLLCGCFRDAANTRILAAHLHPDHLVRFLKEELAAGPPAAQPPAALLVADPSQLPAVTMDYALAARLPPAEWEAALEFFQRPPEPPGSPCHTPLALTPAPTPEHDSPGLGDAGAAAHAVPGLLI